MNIAANFLRLAKTRWQFLSILVAVVFSFFPLFLFAAPNLNKPALAATCSISGTTILAGDNKSVTFNGFAEGESVRIFGTNAQQEIGKTPYSLDGSVSRSYKIPSTIPAGDYNIVVVTRFPVTNTTCSGGPFHVNVAQVYVCTYSFNSTVASGGTVNVTISSNGGGSDNLDLFRASITPGGDIDSRTGPGSITLTAPSTIGSYVVAVANNTKGVLCGGNNALTVTSGTTTWTLSTPTISGSNITFTWSPAANSNMLLRIWDDDDLAKTVVWDSNNPTDGISIDGKTTITVSTSAWDVNPLFPIDGNFGAQLITFGATLSNAVIFNMSGPGPGPGIGCTYTYAPTNVVAGNPITVSIGNAPDGGLGPGTYAAGLANSDGSPLSPTVRATKDGTPPMSIDLTIPATLPAGQYLVTALKQDASGGLIALCGGDPNLLLTVTAPVGQPLPADCQSGTWLDAAFCQFYTTGTYDVESTSLGLFAGTLDSMNFTLWCDSILNPQINCPQNTGAIGLSGQMAANLYKQPPVSGVEYFASQFRKLNPVQDAYAQSGGIGYNALQPVQKIWTAFRNISYVGFVIVFVIIGFMVMFRSKISPQAVATIQDSLPRIVVALILVTFSYAIAGLMIDVMFLILNIAINALVQAQLIDLERSQYVFRDNVFSVVWGSWKDSFGAVYGALRTLINDAIDLPLGFDSVLSWAGGGIAGLVVGIALLFIMFRIFLMLLMAYIMIIILTIAAPFYFLIQALPGNNGARDWFKNMASNVAVFPTVALMFIFAGMLGGINKLGGIGGGAIDPGKVGQFPLFVGGLETDAIGQFIGIGILLITPTAADLVRNAIGVKGGGPNFAGAATAALGAGAGFAMGTAQRGYNTTAGIQKISGYDREGNPTQSRWGAARFVSPAYWKQRSATENARRELIGRKIAGIPQETEPGGPGRRPGGE